MCRIRALVLDIDVPNKHNPLWTIGHWFQIYFRRQKISLIFLLKVPAPYVLQVVIVLLEEKLLGTIRDGTVKQLNLFCERKIHTYSNSFSIPFKIFSRIRYKFLKSCHFEAQPGLLLLTSGCDRFISGLKHCS